MLDYLVTGSSVYCANDRLQVTNDYKKTNRVGQIVSNVSESIKSANDNIHNLPPKTKECGTCECDTALVSMQISWAGEFTGSMRHSHRHSNRYGCKLYF